MRTRVCAPIGAAVAPDGVNCLFSRTPSRVDLLPFDVLDDPRPSRVETLDPATNRTCLEALDFELPTRAAGVSWRRWIDTSRPSPGDIVPWRTPSPRPASSTRGRGPWWSWWRAGSCGGAREEGR